MIKDKNPVTEKILNLTLEIICLLTGEGYMVVKKESDHDTDSIIACESEGLCRTQSLITDQSPNSLTHKRRNDKKLLELNKDLPLPTAEVPVRCEDVAVYLSVEEWEYLEEHKEHYKELTRENHQPLASQGCENVNPELIILDTSDSELSSGDHQNTKETKIHPDAFAGKSSNRNKQERLPTGLYPQDCTKDDNRTTQDYQMEPGDGIFPQQWKEEEIPTDISTGLHRNLEVQHEGHPTCPTAPHCVVNDGNDSHNDQEADFMTGNSPSKFNRTLISNNKPNLHEPLNVTVPTTTEYIEDTHTQISQENMSVVKYECTECDTKCHNEIDFIYHQRTHSDQNLNNCSQFQSFFTDRSNATYELLHTGAEPLPSSECGNYFPQSSNFLVHQRIHIEQRLPVCTDCGKSFSQFSSLVRHKRIHTGEKPYVCSDCGKSFTQISHLVRHRRIHTGEKPFPCLECGKCFTLKSNLLRHHRCHTGERPFGCFECGKGFTSKHLLLKHQRLHTRETSI